MVREAQERVEGMGMSDNGDILGNNRSRYLDNNEGVDNGTTSSS